LAEWPATTPSACKKIMFAGILVGIVALPLAMAFAIASGVTPENGLFTAIIAGAAISIFGGSKVQVGGPTGAMVATLSLIVIQYGTENLLLAGLLAGLMLIAMGVLRTGAIIRFIPFPVTTGFTAGIAILIFTGQINSFLGLTGIARYGHFHLNFLETILNSPSFQLTGRCDGPDFAGLCAHHPSLDGIGSSFLSWHGRCQRYCIRVGMECRNHWQPVRRHPENAPNAEIS
jgi:MFS superfamily sulfate permease-like transporter